MKKLLFLTFGFLLVQNLESQNIVRVNEINYELVYGKQAIVTKGDYKGKIAIPGSITSAGVNYKVTRIGGDAFKNCKELTNITLPPTIEYIADYAFYECENLLTISIPASVSNIGNAAFGGCKKLTSLNIPASAKIERWVFLNCGAKINVDPKNQDYSSLNGVLYSKDKAILIRCPITIAGIFTIPSSVTFISESAFEGCNSITEVKIPETVQTIDLKAFYNCENLKSVYVNSAKPPMLNIHVFEKDYDEEMYYNYEEFKESYATIYVPSGSINTYLSSEYWKDYKIVETNFSVQQK